MHYINDIRELIGNTPLLKLNRIAPGTRANLFAKLEYLSPGGSVKDRVGHEILTVSKQQGLLKPGATIIEATAGNTGIGLAMAAFEQGYHLKLVIPAKFAIEKQVLMRALGAEIIVTPTEDGIEGAMQKAQDLAAAIPNSFMPRQFENKLNVAAHRKTGKEIYDALDGKIDVFVAGAGSGGTIMGIASYFKEMNPNIKIVLADPEGSILGGGEEGSYHIEGIGNHFIPSIFDASLIDEVQKISDEEASYYVQLLGKKEGVLVGSSSGAAIAGAVKEAYRASKEINIVTVFPDRSDRYFSQNLYDFEFNLSDFRFNALFDGWADAYDATVADKDGEYQEVFINYQAILKQTVKQIDQPEGAKVLDIGSGTGNLAYVASLANYAVTGIEPNQKMRKLAADKYPSIYFIEGSFLNIPVPDKSVDAIICSYAFHHLSDDEKGEAINIFASKLKPSGKVVIADTMYRSPEDGEAILQDALSKGYHNLANDLQTEFYTTHTVLKGLFTHVGFSITFEQMNKFVWILTATKA
ncbi:pyridoxal-phosphate dependent enzyme [Cellulosilyticum sp. I15G10I2]|uniref:pyridoxal-phosphate dependent enzyme n=1 Tax=Cellulosilyticum sp. I15G10I2 TaxID=1892843 RepID=UPI00085BC87D|nr:pyridoxal-phosphate dependent enzyme [Cellulosilyticum sp. I15G10I2]